MIRQTKKVKYDGHQVGYTKVDHGTAITNEKSYKHIVNLNFLEKFLVKTWLEKL